MRDFPFSWPPPPIVGWRLSWPLAAHDELRAPGDVAGRDHSRDPVVRALEVAIQERDRDALDDRQLRLLVGVGRQVPGAEQLQEVLGSRREPEERIGEARLVDRVGSTLGGEQRRAWGREVKAAGARDLGA